MPQFPRAELEIFGWRNTGAIPTRYAGVQFRSRLEARWAAFFDIVGWRWEYEPFDLKGYIPDFILSFHRPLLVEVKPLIWRLSGDTDEGVVACAARWKIVRSAWDHEAMLCGVSVGEHLETYDAWCKVEDWCSRYGLPFNGEYPYGHKVAIGALLDRTWCDGYDVLGARAGRGPSVNEGAWGSAVAALCRVCGAKTVVHQWASYRCRVNDCYLEAGRGTGHLDVWDPLPDWREAGNRVQWTPR